MNELVTFLLACLAEDEAVARPAAGGSSWKPFPRWVAGETNNAGIRREDGVPVAGHSWPHEMDHIARFDPTRVLADVAAKRAILDLVMSTKHAVVEGDCWFTCAAATEEVDGGETCNDIRRGEECDCGRDALVDGVLRRMLQPYADRPGFDPEWRMP